jgi:hypothetical protein
MAVIVGLKAVECEISFRADIVCTVESLSWSWMRLHHIWDIAASLKWRFTIRLFLLNSCRKW